MSTAYDWDFTTEPQDAPLKSPSAVQHLSQDIAITFFTSSLHLESLLGALGGWPVPSAKLQLHSDSTSQTNHMQASKAGRLLISLLAKVYSI